VEFERGDCGAACVYQRLGREVCDGRAEAGGVCVKILVTGATGFVGRHVVQELISRQHDVVAVARNLERAKEMPWYGKAEFFACDIHDVRLDLEECFGVPDTVIHLAWPGLPNYKDLFHYEENLFSAYGFIKNIVTTGVKHVVVTGTCLEYGMQGGMLSEDAMTKPVTPYGLAKDTLRKFLQEFQVKQPFTLQWVRLFYMHGPGQNANSLLAQLDRAIDKKEAVFNMSGGEQLRDYLPVEDVARYLVSLAEHLDCAGVINCCSGQPVSVRQLVEQRIAERKAKIKLNLGYYSYPDYEPMEFWGDATKLHRILGVLDEGKD
jgi:dTDP-6-deoxy-L-talose 4-dehydrogenase (NAD+)